MKSLYILILFIFVLLVSCQKSQKQSVGFEESPSFKEILSSDSLKFLEYYDSSSNIYSNFYYGFSVNVPEGWSSDRGFSKNTVFRLTNYDSGIVFSITVVKISEPDDFTSASMWGPFLQDSSKYLKGFKRGIEDQFGTEIFNLKVTPVYYINHKSLKSSYHYLFRSDELEYLMYSESFQFLKNGNIYTVGINIPKDFIDENKSYYNLKNNFTLIPVRK